eukprot:19095-Heterococcus_DN1.PRE.2
MYYAAAVDLYIVLCVVAIEQPQTFIQALNIQQAVVLLAVAVISLQPACCTHQQLSVHQLNVLIITTL